MKNLVKFIFTLMCCTLIFGCKKGEINSVQEQTSDDMKIAVNADPITYYVKPTGNNGNDGKSVGGAFRTLKQAVLKARAGDVVNVLPGQYVWETGDGDAIVNINQSGEAGNPITYQAYDMNNKPVFKSESTNNGNGTFKAILVNANHIVINGFEIIGDNVDSYTASQNGLAKYNTNGIQIGGIYLDPVTKLQPVNVYDIKILNCKIHDFPGGGIATKNAGQIVIDNNEVYNCSLYSQYATSGISILRPNNLGVAANGTTNGDANNPKMIISNNLTYNNRCLVANIAIGSSEISDGNGIIADVNFGYGQLPGDFNGYTRIENNVSYGNGGAGINVTRSRYVNVVNNTTIYNGWKVGYGEINLDNNCFKVVVTNNIFYARAANSTPFPGKAYNNFLLYQGGQITFDYNLYYPYEIPKVVPNSLNINATTSTNATTQSISINPGFVGAPPTYFPQVVPVTNFKIATTSPAKNTGINYGAFYSYFDRDNYYRSTTPDRGAYEFH